MLNGGGASFGANPLSIDDAGGVNEAWWIERSATGGKDDGKRLHIFKPGALESPDELASVLADKLIEDKVV